MGRPLSKQRLAVVAAVAAAPQAAAAPAAALLLVGYTTVHAVHSAVWLHAYNVKLQHQNRTLSPDILQHHLHWLAAAQHVHHVPMASCPDTG